MDKILVGDKNLLHKGCMIKTNIFVSHFFYGINIFQENREKSLLDLLLKKRKKNQY